MKEKKNAEKGKSVGNIHSGHRDRMRARFIENGFEGMSDHEVIEMLLYYAIPRRNTNDIAHELIHRFNDIAGVLEAPLDQLMRVEGIGDNAAVFIKMMLPLLNRYHSKRSNKTVFDSIDKCARYLISKYAGIVKERISVLCLDSNCREAGYAVVSEGDAGSVSADRRQLVEAVLRYPTTVSVVLAHNHPGGMALPSREDLISTGELAKALKSLNILLIDHIIIAENDYVSLTSSPEFKKIFKQR